MPWRGHAGRVDRDQWGMPRAGLIWTLPRRAHPRPRGCQQRCETFGWAGPGPLSPG